MLENGVQLGFRILLIEMIGLFVGQNRRPHRDKIRPATTVGAEVTVDSKGAASLPFWPGLIDTVLEPLSKQV